jgi:hypothetical protein
MFAPAKYERILRSPELDLTSANFPAQTKRIPIPSTDPIEAMYIAVQVTMNAAVNGFIDFGLLSILKRVTLNIQPDDGAGYDCVYSSGTGLCQLLDQEGIGLDRSTRAALMASMCGHGNLANPIATISGSKYLMVFPIYFAHPALTGEARLRSLLDCQNHRQDPVLQLDFAPATEISATANPFSAANCEVWVRRRAIGADLNKAIRAKGGFFRQDIRESQYDVAASLTSVEKKFAIPSPGEYASLVVSMYKGNAVRTPADISASVAVGTETTWSLEAAGNSIAKFATKGMMLMGDHSRAIQPLSAFHPLNADAINSLANTGVTGGAPPVWVTAKEVSTALNFGGALSAGLAIQDPSVYGFDFLTDGLTDAGEFGSLLNANFPSDAVKWELIAPVTTPANQPSAVWLTGRRFRSDVSDLKKFAA